ncbi:hypothetical protein [Hymenobacter wooponensis]|uniref:Uncharacterized protein n=1 Tax=Hymenobacter wooponensis TaxID=1525360 RepID=A0A4Z0MEE8_9BACT|nr:hypothetical protein [Hymenobacter wooponensis]TGD77849.1 hypothetical protein EU557_21375 [Hymenobacter wooponensis]
MKTLLPLALLLSAALSGHAQTAPTQSTTTPPVSGTKNAASTTDQTPTPAQPTPSSTPAVSGTKNVGSTRADAPMSQQAPQMVKERPNSKNKASRKPASRPTP